MHRPHPRAPFVVEADARRLLVHPVAGIARSCDDLLVVYPPTYPAWSRSSPLAGGPSSDEPLASGGLRPI